MGNPKLPYGLRTVNLRPFSDGILQDSDFRPFGTISGEVSETLFGDDKPIKTIHRQTITVNIVPQQDPWGFLKFCAIFDYLDQMTKFDDFWKRMLKNG